MAPTPIAIKMSAICSKSVSFMAASPIQVCTIACLCPHYSRPAAPRHRLLGEGRACPRRKDSFPGSDPPRGFSSRQPLPPYPVPRRGFPKKFLAIQILAVSKFSQIFASPLPTPATPALDRGRLFRTVSVRSHSAILLRSVTRRVTSCLDSPALGSHVSSPTNSNPR